MKTAEEILRDHASNFIWDDLGGNDFIIDNIPGNIIIEAMSKYAEQFYQKEQMIAFGEDLTKRFNELTLHERSWAKNEREALPKGSDGTQDAWFHAYGLGIIKAQKLLEQTLIEISKLLKT